MDSATDARLIVPVLDTYQALVSAFTEFLTVAVHTILYERNIYPRESFLNTRKYNHPVPQNRHPRVCAWIQDAVAAVEAEMLKCTIAQTSLIIYSTVTSIPLERYVFSTTSFPIVAPGDVLSPFETSTTTTALQDPFMSSSPPASPSARSPSPLGHKATSRSHTALVDLTVQFPPVIQRLSMLGSRLAPLPPDCSFTLAVELKEKPQGVAPIGWPMPWVPSEPGSQRAEMGANADDTGSGENGDSESSERVKRGGNLGGVKTTPIRSVEAGPFVMEIWAEEGREKMKVKTEVEDGEGAAKTEKTS